MNSNNGLKTAFWAIVSVAAFIPILAIGISFVIKPIPSNLTVNGSKFNTSEYSHTTDYGLYLSGYDVSQVEYANKERLQRYTKDNTYLEFYYTPTSEVYKYSVFSYEDVNSIVIGDTLKLGESKFDDVMDYFGRALFKVETSVSSMGHEMHVNKYHVSYNLYFDKEDILYGVVYKEDYTVKKYNVNTK